MSETAPDVGKLQAAVDRANACAEAAIARATEVFAPPEPDVDAVLAPPVPPAVDALELAGDDARRQADSVRGRQQQARRSARFTRRLRRAREAKAAAIKRAGQWVVEEGDDEATL